MNTDISDAAQAVAITCTMCQTDFPSKRKLFRHLETVHDLVSDRAQPCKVACLVGWLSHEGSDIESYLKDSRLVSNDGPRLLVDENGNALDNFPLVIEFPFTTSPTIEDIDLDGDLDVFISESLKQGV